MLRRILLSMSVIALLYNFSSTAVAQVIRHDIQDWIDVQPGKFIFNNDPDINEDGVPDGEQYLLFWDYLGTDEQSSPGTWGTEVTGRVTERQLGGGRSHVIVTLQVSRANIFVVTAPFECLRPVFDLDCFLDRFNNACTVFGFRSIDVVEGGATPALADGYFRLEFETDSADPITSLFEPQVELLSFQMRINAVGPLMQEECGVDLGHIGRLAWGKPGHFDNPAAIDPTKVHGMGLTFPNDDFHLFEIRQGRGGSLEEIPRSTIGTFTRGDANADDRFDMSDPVGVLRYLYTGDFAPECLDAADVNDDSAIDISDAIGALAYLFSAGPAPAAPYPEKGIDPTEDGLDCSN